MGIDSSKPDKRVGFVGTDFAAFGREGADLLAKATGEKAVIGITSAGPDVQPHVVAIKAFKEQIKAKYPNMKVVQEVFNPTDYVKGAEILRGMLVGHSDITAVWSPDGRGGIDAAAAARQLRKKPGDITIIGSDHLPQVSADLKSGWQYASPNFVSCNWGKFAVDAMDEYFKTGTVAKNVNYVPNVIWTKDNP